MKRDISFKGDGIGKSTKFGCMIILFVFLWLGV